MLIPSIFGRYRDYSPQTNVNEGDKEYTMEITLPGLNKGDIDVKLDKGRLVISANNESEQRRVSYNQSFTLTDDIDQSGISAKYENGILTIHLPKTKETIDNTRKIEVS